MSQLKNIQDEKGPIWWLPRLAVRGAPRFLQIANAWQVAGGGRRIAVTG